MPPERAADWRKRVLVKMLVWVLGGAAMGAPGVVLVLLLCR